jgi:membrane protein DedA with SNARE-associated domain
MFIFLQELGIPNPVTNELVLMFSGYMAYNGTLSFTTVIIVAVSADFIGTTILYFIFYILSNYLIFNNPPRWLAKFSIKLDHLKQRMDNGNKWAIFVGRLTPFLRGYISVAAGTLQIKPVIFLTTVLFSAIAWSGGLVLTGRLLGPYWNEVAQKVGVLQFAGIIILFIIAMLLAGKYVVRKELAAKVSKKAL